MSGNFCPNCKNDVIPVIDKQYWCKTCQRNFPKHLVLPLETMKKEMEEIDKAILNDNLIELAKKRIF